MIFRPPPPATTSTATQRVCQLLTATRTNFVSRIRPRTTTTTRSITTSPRPLVCCQLAVVGGLLRSNARPAKQLYSTTAATTTTAATKASSTTASTSTGAEEGGEETVPIIFVDPDGTETEVQAKIGEHLLDVAHANHVELEGACGGELACSTCHLIFPEDIYPILPKKSDEEDDMLDLAFHVTETSRLGCQIPVRKEYAGMKVKIPDDGF